MCSQNPLVIFINLLTSTITQAIFTYRRQPTRVSFVYLTHITALLSIFSGINYFFPGLSWDIWGIILLVMMVCEWGLFFLQTKIIPETRRVNPISFISILGYLYLSDWHLGLVLALLSYFVWLGNLEIFAPNICTSINCQLSAEWGII